MERRPGAGGRQRGRVVHDAGDQRRRHVPRFEPVAVEVEEAVVGPVAGREEEDEEQHGAVHAGSVQEVGRDEEGQDEEG